MTSLPFKSSKPAERLNPLNDYLFLKMMGEKGDEEQPLSFLNAVLKHEGKDKLASVSIDKESRWNYEMREMAMYDWNSGVNHAKREDKLETAHSMKTDNMPIELIMKYTGLSAKDIENA